MFTSNSIFSVVALLAARGLAERLSPVSRAVETYHPGHRAAHVVRLHRYEHAGEAAMLEAEASWAARSARSLRAGELSLPPRPPGRLLVAPAQVAALELHQAQHRRARGREGLDAPKGGLEKSERLEEAQAPVGSSPAGRAVTGLSSLSSQYVGPIGVGTRLSPQGCQLPAAGNPAQPGAASLAQQGGTACTAQPEEQVWVVYDTGSTNLWVSSDLCQQGPCRKQGRHRYDHKASTTFSEPSSAMQLTVQFGTGKLTGPQGIDDVHVGPISVHQQTFELIEKEYGNVFDEVPFEGILGLAFPAMSANHVKPFFDTVIEQKALEKNEFGFYFSLDDPSANAVFWGGVDPAFHKGPIEYFPVVEPFYWSLRLHSFHIGDKELLGEHASTRSSLAETGSVSDTESFPRAIVDTGTTFFTAEGQMYDTVVSMLPRVSCDSMTDKTHPPITYQLENAAGQRRDFTLTNDQYMVGKGECTPAFMRVDVPPAHGPAMVLGECFMRHFFSVFDRGDGGESSGRVGFAPAAHGVEADRQLRRLTGEQPTFEAQHNMKKVEG